MRVVSSRARWGTIALVFGILSFTCGHAQDSTLNRLSAAEKAAGWILLFDGVDRYAHFRVAAPGTEDDWYIYEQSLSYKTNSRFSDLFSTESYANFELSMEWKMNRASKSGIYIRVTGANRECSGEEYAILDDINGDERNEMGHMPGETAMPIKRTAADYDMYPTVQDGVPGHAYVEVANYSYYQWNQGTIWANGNLIEHWLNGKKVNDYDVSSPDWLQRFKLSKYYDLCPNDRDTWGRHPSGPIGMLAHGGGMRVWFRNIKIRPFTPGGKLAAPLVSPAGGKINGSAKVTLDAAIIGATLHYTLDGSDPTAASPVYQDSLILKSGATLKARTYRTGFATSDVATAVFTSGSTGFKDAVGKASGEPSWRQLEKGIRLLNPGSGSLTVAVRGIDGKGGGNSVFGPGQHDLDLSGMHGLCLVTLRRGEWVRTGKLVMP